MDISLFRAIATQYKDLRGVHSVATLNAIGRLIEEEVLSHKLPVDLYAGFGLFSHFSDQIPRYTRLGSVCRRVFVFGVPNVQPPSIPGVEFIELSPNSALGSEQFLLVNTSNFWTTLLAQEVEGGNLIQDGGRYDPTSCPYDGGWFYDEHLVERVSLLLSQAMGTYYQPIKERNYVQQSAHIAEINRRLLGQMQEAQLSSDRRSMQLSTLHQFSAILLQHQPLPCILRDCVQILSMIFGANDAVVALNLHDEKFMIVSANGSVSTNHTLASLGDGASSQAYREGKLISMDTRKSDRIEPLMPKAETIFAAPIKGRGRSFGVVTVGGSQGHRWNKDDGQTVMAIASMLAVIIEQKTQVSGDIVIQLRRARHLEQVMRKLRKPIASLLVLQRKLRDEGNISPTQLETLAEIESLYSDLALTLGVPRNVIRATKESSKLSRPPKSPPVFGGKLRAPEPEIDALAATRLAPDAQFHLGSGEL